MESPVNGWLSLTELAARDGVSVPAVSKQVKKLRERHALEVRTDSADRVVAVNAAHYDLLRGHAGAAIRDQRPAQPVAADPLASSYDAALARKTGYDAELRRLQLEEASGKLLVAASAVDAFRRIIGEIVQEVDRLVRIDDEIALAVGHDGRPGARRVLKAEALRLRRRVAAAHRELLALAPANDTLPEDGAAEMPLPIAAE